MLELYSTQKYWLSSEVEVVEVRNSSKFQIPLIIIMRVAIGKFIQKNVTAQNWFMLPLTAILKPPDPSKHCVWLYGSSRSVVDLEFLTSVKHKRCNRGMNDLSLIQRCRGQDRYHLPVWWETGLPGVVWWSLWCPWRAQWPGWWFWGVPFFCWNQLSLLL